MPITNITPTTVTNGTHVTVTGYELSPNPEVTINGNPYPNIVSYSDTQVVFVVDNPISVDSPVRVTNQYQVASWSSQDLHYIPALTVSNATPDPIYVGQYLTVTGTGFTTDGNTFATINGVVASLANGLMSSVGTTSFVVLITAGMYTGAAGLLSVTNPLGTVNWGTSLYIGNTLPAPTISSISSLSGNVGASITLTGTNFDTTSGNTVVRVGGVPAVITNITGTQIIFTVPSGVTSGAVTVTTGSGTATAPGGNFTVTGLVTITSFSPIAGVIGTSVVINGSGFDPTPANNTVKFNPAGPGGGVVASVGAASSTQLTVTVPAGATTGDISVATTQGSVVSAAVFSVSPVISALSPLYGGTGSYLTITGTGFDPASGATVVRVNGVIANITSISPTSISTQIPVGASSGVVTVTTAGGVATSSVSFTVTNTLPTISGFAPASGPVGASVVITGTNFDTTPANNKVQFNGVAAVPTVSSATSITVAVPQGATTGPVTISNVNGVVISSQSFAVTLSPGNIVAQSGVISFTPSSGPVGTSVTIVGTGFSAVLANNVVTFNGTMAGVSAASVDQLSVTVPAGATTGVVAVIAGGVTQISSQVFVVTAIQGASPPAIDVFAGMQDDGVLTPQNLVSYLRALLKDTDKDITQLGLTAPTWGDPDLYRYLELARGEYTRQRPKRVHTTFTTVATVQSYPLPSGCLGVDDVYWNPTGYDLDAVTALAASLAGGGGVLWGGGVPIVGQVYFDSPASIQIWSIIREAWRKAFGGRWASDDAGIRLMPAPTNTGGVVLMFYRLEQGWSDIPWQHRMFILTNAVLYAIEALTYQIVAQSPAQGQKLNLGLRALAQMVQYKYGQTLGIREPGVTAGRS